MIDGMKVTFPYNHAIIKQAHFFRKHMTYFKVITYLSLLTSGSHHLFISRSCDRTDGGGILLKRGYL